MQDQVALLFCELVDLGPAERERYFEQHRVPAALQAEVESLLSFDSPDEPLAELIAGEAVAVAFRGRPTVRRFPWIRK